MSEFKTYIAVFLAVIGTLLWFMVPIFENFTKTWDEPHNRIRKINAPGRTQTAIGHAWKDSFSDTILILGVSLIVSGLVTPISSWFIVVLVFITCFVGCWLIRCIGIFPKYIYGVNFDEWLPGLFNPRFWPYLFPLSSFFLRRKH